jgi:hypothetical protein
LSCSKDSVVFYLNLLPELAARKRAVLADTQSLYSVYVAPTLVRNSTEHIYKLLVEGAGGVVVSASVHWLERHPCIRSSIVDFRGLVSPIMVFTGARNYDKVLTNGTGGVSVACKLHRLAALQRQHTHGVFG